MGRVKLAILLAIIAVVLATVKWTSISGGPSSDDAMIAVRVAQRDLFVAKMIRSGAEKPSLKDAEAALNLALSLLDEKRYEDAVVAAYRVTTLSRHLPE